MSIEYYECLGSDLGGERFTAMTVIVGAGDVWPKSLPFLAALSQIQSRASFKESASRIAPFSRGDLKARSAFNGMNVTSERSLSLPTTKMRLRRSFFAHLMISIADLAAHFPVDRPSKYISYSGIFNIYESFKVSSFVVKAVKSTASFFFFFFFFESYSF
jgi:hypothetical protein